MLETAKVLTTLSQCRQALAKLDSSAPVYLDTETTGLNPRRNKLVALQLYQDGDDTALIFDWRCRPAAENTWLASLLSDFLTGVPVVVGHSIKFDVNFLAANLIRVGKLFDVKVAEQVLVGMGAQEGVSYGLKDLVYQYHGEKLSKEERTWFYKPKPLDERPDEWNAPFPEEEVRYMALDVTTLPYIHKMQSAALAKGLGRVFSLEMRVLPALAEMEQHGIRIDMTGWRSFIAEKAQQATALEGELLAEVALPILEARLKDYDEQRAAVDRWQEQYDAHVATLRAYWETVPDYPSPTQPKTPWGEYKQARMEVWREENPRPATPKQDITLPNVDSQEQMVGALLSLDIPLPTKRNKQGDEVYTLDAKRLAEIEDEFPILQLLNRERKAKKFVVAFGDNLLEMAEPEDDRYGRLYPTFNSIGAATGRMSCQDPNWQQVPSRGDGVRLRQLVVPAPGCKLVVSDFSNIEWRIMAAVSKDKTAIGWLADGLDIHCEVARKVWNLGEMTREEMEDRTAGPIPGWSYRDLAKTVNYGLLYGMSAVRLSRTAKTDRATAEKILADYFDALPGFRVWLDQQGTAVLRDLNSHTLLGRKRAYLEPTTGKERGRVRRQGCNAVIQGTSADITKGAVALYHESPRHGWLVAVVHDELCLEVPTRWAEQEARLLEDKMDAAQVSVLPLPRAALPRPVAVVADYWRH